MISSIFRRGVTLVELLVTMTIIAIIAAAVLGTTAAAIESARERRTKSTIAKIHELIMERYASYETRRIDVDPSIVQAIDRWAAEAVSPVERRVRTVARGQMLADARLLGLRELMKLEMPDRWMDVTYVPQILSDSPPLAKAYYRYYQQSQATVSDEQFAERGETLYMVVMLATGDGEARMQFSKQEIGDVDGDGAREFVDGWGSPIGWIRWPAGVVSDLQPLTADGKRPGEADHDPFDPFRRDSPTVTWPPLDCYPDAGPRNGSFRKTYYLNMRKRMEKANSATMSHLTAFRMVPWIASRRGKHRYFILRPDDDSAANYPLDPYLAPFDTYQAGSPDPDFPDESKENITNHGADY
jgi:prepilin-type N-terminal cleavage/methylation domain-containing protein